MQSKNHSALTNSMDFYFERAGGAAVAVTGRVKNPPFERARGRRGVCSYRAP